MEWVSRSYICISHIWLFIFQRKETSIGHAFIGRSKAINYKLKDLIKHIIIVIQIKHAKFEKLVHTYYPKTQIKLTSMT